MKVRLHEPTFGEEEISAAVAVMRSTNVTQGEKVREFERAFCDKFGFAHAVACNSGSSANLLAIAAMLTTDYLRPLQEVIVPALSWPTTIWPIIQHGLVPVFADCDPNTLNMAVTDEHHDMTMMPVHVYGNSRRSVGWGLQIEDCCEALGATDHSGRPIGNSADIATFSFYYSHHITTFEGGMVATNSSWLADRLRIHRSHGWIRDCENKAEYDGIAPDIDRKFLFVDTGYNLRMTEIQAAVGLVQLPKLDEFVRIRRENHKAYEAALSKYKFLRCQRMHEGSACFGFAITLDGAPFGVKELRAHLEDAGIETRSIIAGNMAMQPAMKKYPHRTIGDLPNATNVMRNGFSIGNHQAIGEEQIAYVAEQIVKFVCAR